MPSLSPPPPNMQRPDSGRGGKRGKPKRGRAAATAVGVPLAAAALFAGALLYTSRYYFHTGGSYEDHIMMEIHSTDPGATRHEEQQQRQRSKTATVAAASDDGGGGALLLSPLSAANGLLGDLEGLEAGSGGSGSSGVGADTIRRSSWLSAALLWAEDHHQQRLKAKAGRYQAPTGCGALPCAAHHLQRHRTLVLYAYAAADAEQQANFEYFLRYGVEEQEWLRYRLIIASGAGVLAPTTQPELPPNAHYIHTNNCTTGPWGIIAAVAPQLEAELAMAQHVVVVGSDARGPFMPPYTKQFMHWTDAFISKLSKRTKLVGAALTCEGAPKGGDAAEEWRQNPFVLPYAWATDKEGWALMAATPGVLRCYASPWDARYHSDAGASLGLLTAGHNIDSLLAKYQGMDWWNRRTWGCNRRVRPDAEWTYDGVSITPYETVFVPVSQGSLQSEWSFVRQAAKYTVWQDSQAVAAPQGNSNAFVSEQWSLRMQRMVYQNARGPGCFDFDYYVQANPDLATKAAMQQVLWEHFVIVGQFQGRAHRFTCPLQVGNSYRTAAVRARGRRCFDHNYYAANNLDVRLAGITEAYQLFNHYANFGQFEQRLAKFVCTDLLRGLPVGYDSRPLEPVPQDPEQQNAAKWQGLAAAAAAEAAAAAAKLRQQGSISVEDDAALAAKAEEAGSKAAKVAQRVKVDVATAAAASAAAMEAERQAAIAGAMAQQAAAMARERQAQREAQKAQQQQEQAQQAAVGAGAAAAVMVGVAAADTVAAGTGTSSRDSKQQQDVVAQVGVEANSVTGVMVVGQETQLAQQQAQQLVGVLAGTGQETVGNAANAGAVDRSQAAGGDGQQAP